MAQAWPACRLLAADGRCSSVGGHLTVLAGTLPARPPLPPSRRPVATRWLRLACTLLALAALPGLAGCGSRMPIEHAMLAESGQGAPASVQELLARSDTVALLVYDPADCFQCVGNVARWLTVSRQRPGQVVFLLTRPPSERELESMSRLRIPAGTVLADHDAVILPPLPSELLYVQGRLVEADSTASQLGSQRVLGLLADQH